MRTLVLTGYDEKFRPLGELTTPLMEAYARRHGFDFHLMLEGDGFDFHPSWWKMQMLPRLFNVYDRVIWMDADVLVTNLEVVPPGERGYHCSLDWGADATQPHMLSNGCFCAFPDSVAMIRWVLDRKDDYSCEFHEQEHMRAAARILDVICVHPRRVFNAVPIEVHESAVEPWQPGDWIAHLTMVDLARRVELVGIIGEQASKSV